MQDSEEMKKMKEKIEGYYDMFLQVQETFTTFGKVIIRGSLFRNFKTLCFEQVEYHGYLRNAGE
jgi:hypothetical protein